jgi:hypothetical protein
MAKGGKERWTDYNNPKRTPRHVPSRKCRQCSYLAQGTGELCSVCQQGVPVQWVPERGQR